MKKNLKLIFVVVAISLVFLISGIFIGKYVLEASDNDKTNINNDNNSFDMDTSYKERQLALGKYLYYLAEAIYFNCGSVYFDTTTENNVLLINNNNYDELKNSFTNEFIKNTEFLPPLFSDCYVKMDNGKVDVSNCWFGLGSPNGVYTKLVDFTVISSNDNEIIYEVFIT